MHMTRAPRIAPGPGPIWSWKMLAGDQYAEHGRSGPGQEVTSVLLPDFTVAAPAVFGGN